MSSLFSWTTLAVAAVALILILIAFRVVGRMKLTFRFRGAVSVSPWAQKPCPHLGLLEEPFIHRDEPEEEHRCYLWMQRDRIDLAHQKGFCLSSAHANCPWLSISPVPKPPLPRRLKTATVVAATQTWAISSLLATEALLGLIFAYRRVMATTQQGADFTMPVVVPLVKTVAGKAAKHAMMAAELSATTSRNLAVASYLFLGRFAGFAANKTVDTARQAMASRQPALPPMTTIEIEPELVDVPEPFALPANVIPPVLSLPPLPERGSASHVDNLMEQGKVAGMSGNRKLGYSLFSLATELEPDNDEAWLWKGAMADTVAERFECLQRALAISPGNKRALQAMEQLGLGPVATSTAADSSSLRIGSPEALGANIPLSAGGSSEEVVMARALKTLENGDEEGAFQLFVKATEMNSRSEKAWFWRAKTAATLEEVIYALEQALAINPGNEKVRVNLLWAIQRQQKEEEAREAERRAAAEVVKLKKEQRKQGRSIAAICFRWLAALVCLVLAAYWSTAAIMPILEEPLLKDALASLQGGAEIDLTPIRPLYESVLVWLPGLNWVSLPWYDKLEIVAGYNLAAALPYTIGFLYFFVGVGVLRRESWSRFWALAVTTLSLGLGALFTANSQTVILLYTLGIATILTLLVSRSEFRAPVGDGRP